MPTQHWPLFGLRLRTPRLELRLPTLDDLGALADLAAEGVHDPARQPFTVPWTDEEPAVRARATVQYHWGTWSRWQPDDWSMQLVTVLDGQVVGTQGMSARQFAIVREVATGSWLGQRFQRRGIGVEMRAAVLHLAFEGLGAESAISSAFTDNEASLGVSRRLGYVHDGIERHASRGRAAVQQRLRLDRAAWAAARTVDVSIEGLAACRAMFGI